jgi:hypothetical protein
MSDRGKSDRLESSVRKACVFETIAAAATVNDFGL